VNLKDVIPLTYQRQGTRIEHIKPKRFKGRHYVTYPEEMKDGKVGTQILVCNGAEAPNWKTSGKPESRHST
jgi:hypothetical protein